MALLYFLLPVSPKYVTTPNITAPNSANITIPLELNNEANGIPVTALVTFVGMSEHPTPVSNIQFWYVKFPKASFNVGIVAVKAEKVMTNKIIPPTILPRLNPLNFAILFL